MTWRGRFGGPCLAFGLVATVACQDDSQERARRVAEVERAAAEAEAGGTQPPPAGAQAGTPRVTGPQVAAAPAADHAAWAAAIAHDVEAIDRRSRGPARAYAQAQGPLREALRQSMCGGKP